MQIILQEDVEKLGTRGQIVEVAEGYARNYLLPRKLALAATPANLKRLEKMRGIFAQRAATEKEAAQKLSEVLAGLTVKLGRKAGEQDQLFGSVTSADVAEGLKSQGYEIDRRKIQLNSPIKTIGEYQVPLKLHHEVTASLRVLVEREG